MIPNDQALGRFNTPCIDLATMHNPDRDHYYQLARDHFNAERYREAIKCLSRIRFTETYGIKANSNIASCLMMLGLVRPALTYVDRALKLDPSYTPALINRVKAFQAQARHEDALAICQEILERNPKEEEAWKHRASCLCANHQPELALSVVRQWLNECPDSLHGHLMQGELLSNQGNHNEAIQSFTTALRIAPEAEKPYAHMSVVMYRIRRYEDALKYLEKALEINPESLNSHCWKAHILWFIGSWRESLIHHRKASSLRPDSAIYFLNQHLILPCIIESTEEIDEAREGFLKGLSLAENNADIFFNPSDTATAHTFFLAYHNKEDRLLLERYINLMRKLSTPLLNHYRQQHHHKVDHPTAIDHERIRIGFLSQNFSNHSNTLAFEGLIRHLDRQSFEVILIHTANSKKDDIRDNLDAACEKSVVLPSDLSEVYKTLHTLDLDILFFTDLGMNSYEFLLPLFRMAPIQMTGWGIPHTSGIKEIDYYITSTELEPPEAQANYTETLVRLQGGLPCCFQKPGQDYNILPREYFILPPGDTLIGCLQGLHKLHPDYDLILEEIAVRNPEVGFVFVEDELASRSQIFLDRLAKSAPSVRERCVFLAIMQRHEYQALCNCVDLLLDPIYYGSGITFFEASFVGTPIVTMEGSNLRTRVVASGYREMGIEDPPITKTKEEYVELVTMLVNEPERRESMRASILANNHRVFNRMDHIRSFEQFCLQAVKSERHRDDDHPIVS